MRGYEACPARIRSRGSQSGPPHQAVNRRRLLGRLAGFGIALPVTLSMKQSVASAASPEPPIAEARPETHVYGGVEISDPYAWLEDPTDPDVIAYLEAENAYREAMLEPVKSLRETLYKEMLGRIQETDSSVPTPLDGWFYYTRTQEGKQYEILVRKEENLDAPEQLVLDLNVMATGDYIDLITWSPSPDHRYLAYIINETGGDDGTLRIKDLANGVDLAEEMYPVAEVEWANDSKTLFYTRQDEDTLRASTLYRHTLGENTDDDPLLHSEDDDAFELFLTKANDGSYLFVQSFNYETTESRYLSADDPTGELVLFAPRRDGIQYYLEHHDGDFLVLTNEDAPNLKLMAVPVADQPAASWRELVPHRSDALLELWDVLAGHVALYGCQQALAQVWIYDFASGNLKPLQFDEAVYDVWPGANWTYDTTKLRVEYTSFVTPITTYEIDLVTGERTLLKQEPVRGGHDPGEYISERLFARTADGKEIPISMVRRRDAGDGPVPMVLQGYGAYGYSSEIYFDSNRLSLLDRGVAHAQAHIRGGSDLGRAWYEDGKLLHKRNTFTDYIACAEHLISTGHTAPDRLVANGASAGGLVMGFVANERPDLFAAIFAEVPWTDVVRTMLDPTIPLVTAEYTEWGDPRDPKVREYMYSYSPYDNIRPQDYPAMLITAGLEDDRVMYWDPTKWVAKLRANKTDDNPLFLRMNMGTGHSGASGRYDYLREIAHDTAFILLVLGLTDQPLLEHHGVAPPVARKGVTTQQHSTL